MFLNKSKMLVAGQKCKHIYKTLREKAQLLIVLELFQNFSLFAKNGEEV